MVKGSLPYRDPRTPSVRNETSNKGGKHRRTVRGKKSTFTLKSNNTQRLILRCNTARHTGYHHDGASGGFLCRVQTAQTTVGTADK